MLNKTKKQKKLAIGLISMIFLLTIMQNLNIFNSNTENNIVVDEDSQSIDEMDNIEASDIITEEIRINGSATGQGAHNWTWAQEQGYVSRGDGSQGNPYIIENLEINCQKSHSGIEIVDSRWQMAMPLYFRIENNIIYNIGSLDSHSAGIKLYKTQYGTIRNNIISSNTDGNYGIHLVGYSFGMWPPYMDTTKYINITANTITNTEIGINIEQFCENIIVSENEARYNSLAGIYIATKCVNIDILDNILRDNDVFGIADTDSNNYKPPGDYPDFYYGNTIKNNTIYNNTYGLYLSQSRAAIIAYNNISSNNIIGLYISGAAWNKIANNTIANNGDKGIFIVMGPSGSFRNMIWGNEFSGNTEHAVENTKTPSFPVYDQFWNPTYYENNWSYWQSGTESIGLIVGNKWDNYTDADTNDDGFGDTPHKFPGNEDLKPFWNDGIEGHVIFINDTTGIGGSPFNWTGWVSKRFWCTKGDGSWMNPYVISPNEHWDGVIDAWGKEFAIEIVNSIAMYFKIVGLTITNSSVAGIKLYDIMMENSIENNDISSNDGHGLYLEAVKGMTMSDNLIKDNLKTGVYITNHSGDLNFNEMNHIIENIISSNNIDGIYIEKDTDFTNITGNIIENNGRYGVNINETSGGWDGGCNYTIVYNNNFDGNGINANDNGTDTIWYLLPPEVISGRGNYWADYDGHDGDDDGIGDSGSYPFDLYPYKIDGSSLSEDLYPIWEDELEENALLIDALATGVGAHNWTWASRRLFVSGTGNLWDPFVIQNVRFSGDDTTSAITIKNSNTMTSYFRIENCTLDNIGSVDSGSAGIYLENTKYGEIVNNTFLTNYDGNYGIYLSDYCGRINITDNTIDGFKYGIYAYYWSSNNIADPNIFSGNIIKNNIIGIFIDDSSQFNNITDNDIVDNDYIGIYITNNSGTNKIHRNNILSNGIGIKLNISVSANEIINNNIKYNTYFGVYINSSGNIIHTNNFTTTTGLNAQDDSFMPNTWQNDMNFRGNFWSNYTKESYSADVKDANDDGIGDIRFNITGAAVAQDWYPLFDDGHNGSRVIINGAMDWPSVRGKTWCKGSGSPNDPYVISGLVINGTLNGSCIYIYDSSVYFTIEGCELFNSSATASPEPAGGIKLVRVSNALIKNNHIFENDGHGIILKSGFTEMEQSSNITIRDNIIENNNGTGIYINGSYVHDSLITKNTISSNAINGITVGDNAHEIMILNNTLYDNTEVGILVVNFQPTTPGGHYEYPPPYYLAVWVVDPWDRNYIINNTITLGDTGIGVDSSNLINITGNYITQTESNAIATRDFNTRNLTITNNIIYYNDQYGINIGWDSPSLTDNIYISGNNVSFSGSAGIYLTQCFGSILTDNLLKYNEIGIGLTYSNQFNKITGNHIENNNDQGLAIFDLSCRDNIIYENNFTGNGINGFDFGLNNQWYINTPSLKIGNFWDDYLGADADDNGVGDAPYNQIGGNLQYPKDYYPKWWDSPLIDINDPTQNKEYIGTNPTFDIIIDEGLGKVFWYELLPEGSSSVISDYVKLQGNPDEVRIGTINPNLWRDLPLGKITITFYANDTRGYIGSQSVDVFKNATTIIQSTVTTTSSSSDSSSDEAKEDGFFDLWYVRAILTGIISASAGLVIKMSYSAQKRRKELLRKVADNLDRMDNVEKFLKEKLGFENWQKLEPSWNQYQKNEITQMKLIKDGKKSIGKKFTELFIKPKRN